MATHQLPTYQMILNWLDQYHREHPQNGDVVEKLRYLKEKFTESNIKNFIKPDRHLEQSLIH